MRFKIKERRIVRLKCLGGGRRNKSIIVKNARFNRSIDQAGCCTSRGGKAGEPGGEEGAKKRRGLYILRVRAIISRSQGAETCPRL